jgi:uncharacterized protein (TIGR02118 family)
MIKTITVAYRKQGITREEFNKYWLEKHGPLAARLIPNVKRYVQNHLIEIPGMKSDIDGIVEMWYDDVVAWQQSLTAIREAKELMQDGAKFCSIKAGGEWVVEEHVILDKTYKNNRAL